MKLSKKCSNCRRSLPLDMFTVQKTGKHGRNQVCKICAKTYRDRHNEQVYSLIYEAMKNIDLNEFI